MPKHTWKTSVTSDSGSGAVDSLDIYFSTESRIGAKAANLAGLAVGPQDVEKIADLNIQVANIKSFFIKVTTHMRLRVNSEVTPVQEINLPIGTYAWNSEGIPLPSTLPLLVNITSLYFYNYDDTKTGYVIAAFGLQEESQVS